jgi:hypothetical protein
MLGCPYASARLVEAGFQSHQRRSIALCEIIDKPFEEVSEQRLIVQNNKVLLQWYSYLLESHGGLGRVPVLVGVLDQGQLAIGHLDSTYVCSCATPRTAR